MRERLIELLLNFGRNINFCDECNKTPDYCNKCIKEKTADYLLKNGVVVLPCKVGDMVYVLHNTYERIELGLSDCIYETVINSIHISGVIEYHLYYKKISHPDCDFFSDKDIGKKVFLTKEEAEAALEKLKSKE